MATARGFQFGLRSLFVAVVVAAIFASWFRAHLEWQRSIKSQYYIQGGRGFNGTYDNYQFQHFRDHRGRSVAVVLEAFDSYHPNLPTLTQSYEDSMSRGGILTVNGEKVRPSSGSRLYANGPFGYTVMLPLDEADVQKLAGFESNGGANLVMKYWQERVEPQLYKLTGRLVRGERDGPWRYELRDGTLYLEANYRLGERHGDWISYYPNGSVQARQPYLDGKPEGRWSYFDEQGKLIGSLEWKGGLPVNSGSNGGSGANTSVSRWFETGGKRTGFVYSEREGGVFTLEGKTVPRPARVPSAK